MESVITVGFLLMLGLPTGLYLVLHTKFNLASCSGTTWNGSIWVALGFVQYHHRPPASFCDSVRQAVFIR